MAMLPGHLFFDTIMEPLNRIGDRDADDHGMVQYVQYSTRPAGFWRRVARLIGIDSDALAQLLGR